MQQQPEMSGLDSLAEIQRALPPPPPRVPCDVEYVDGSTRFRFRLPLQVYTVTVPGLLDEKSCREFVDSVSRKLLRM